MSSPDEPRRVFALGKREHHRLVRRNSPSKRHGRNDYGTEVDPPDVTGHDKDGKAVALYDAPLKAIQRCAGGNGMTLCWVTSEFPSTWRRGRRPDQGRRAAARQRHHLPHRRFRAGADRRLRRRRSSPDPAQHGHRSGDPGMRGTKIPTAPAPSVTPSCSTARSTCCSTTPRSREGRDIWCSRRNHAWVNNSGKPCRIAFILIDGKTPGVVQGWKK